MYSRQLKFFRFSHIILLFLLFLGGQKLYSQEFSLGIKGGINYSLGKKAAQIDGSAGSFNTKSEIGYQGGVFFEYDWRKFFLRPEAFYSHAEGKFPFPDNASLYSIDKLSFPLLVGYNIYGPFDVYAGPAYQHFLNQELENVPDIENQQKNIAAQFGVKFEFKRFELDLRYDFTLSSKKNQFIDIPGLMQHAYFDDGRLNQLMLSVSFKLWDSENPWRRKRSCYF